MVAINKKKVLKIAQKHVKKGNWDAAIDEYKKLIEDSPKDRNLHNTVGDLYSKKGDNELAIEEYKQAAKSFEEDGFVPQTIALYRKILRIDNSRVEVYSKLAQLYSDQGLTREAIAQFKIVADHYTKKGNVKKALDTYKQIADLDPSNLKVRIRLAELYNKEGLKDQAITEYLTIADMLNKKGSVEESFHCLQKIIEIDPQHLEAQKGLAKLYINKGVFEKAVNSLEVMLENDPDNPQTLFLVGKAYFKAGSYEQAQAAFEKILSMDPSQIGVRENLGRVYLQKGEYDSALFQFDLVIDNFIQKKEYELAKNLLNRLIQFKSDNVRIRERLVEIYQKMGDENRMLEEYKSLATLYIDQNEINKAINVYDNLVQHFPDDPDLKKQLEKLKKQKQSDFVVEQPQGLEEEIEKELDDISVDDLMSEGGIEVSLDQDIDVPLVDASIEDVDLNHVVQDEKPTKVEDIDLEIDETELDLGSEIEDQNIEFSEDVFDEDQGESEVEVPIGDQIDLIEAGTMDQDDDLDVPIEEEVDESEEMSETLDPDIDIPIEEADEADEDIDVPVVNQAEIETYQESAAPEEAPEEELTDEKIIEDHLYHSEVYIKYGMTDKAIEHLNSIVKISPSHKDAHVKMCQLHKDKGNADKAAEEALFLAELFEKEGDQAQATKYFELLAELKPDHPAVPTGVSKKGKAASRVKEVMPEQEAAVSEQEFPVGMASDLEGSVDLSLEEDVDLESDMDLGSGPAIISAPASKPVAERPKVTPSKTKVGAMDFLDSIKTGKKAKKSTTPVPGLSDLEKLASKKIKASAQSLSRLDSLAASVLKPGKKPKAGKATEDALSELESSLVGVTKKKMGITPSQPVSVAELATRTGKDLVKEKPPAKTKEVTPDDYSQEMEEADFYIQQGLIDEARRIYSLILKKYPGADDIREKLEALSPDQEIGEEAEISGLGEELVEEQARDDLFDESAESELEHEESSSNLDFGLGEEMSGVKSTFDEDDEGDDFFNLDGDSNDEGIDLFADVSESEEKSTEHSLQDLFDEFKKGVDEQVSSEDYETHYNLGIAYKEMGLVEEAISEFEKAARSKDMFLQCCSMIGLCHMEGGDYSSAIAEFSKGIETPGYAPEDYLGLEYDRGLCQEIIEDYEGAFTSFSKVYELDAKFREVSAKIKDLRKLVKPRDPNSSPGSSGNVSYV
ncbi:tetratricopeptide repeat protein [bacterium]|nr:tetratricopeptide repeat protein [bacterium]